MLVFLVSLAGIPPTAGFIGKFYIFMAAVNGGMTWLAVVAVIFAAISAFYYLHRDGHVREPGRNRRLRSWLETSPALSFVLACALAGVVFLGLFPNGLWSLATMRRRFSNNAVPMGRIISQTSTASSTPADRRSCTASWNHP